MKKVVRGMLAAVLAVGVLLPGEVAVARDTSFFAGLPEEVPSRDELYYGAADDTRFNIIGEYLLTLSPDDTTELLTYLLRYNSEYASMQAAESLAMLDYYADPEDNNGLWQEWQKLLINVNEAYRETWRQLLVSDKGEFFRQVLSEETVNSLLSGKTASAAELSELAAIRGMAEEYWNLAEKEYTVTYQGKRYTFEDLADIADDEVYNEVYLLLAKERNAGLSALLARTIPSANSYAVRKGYASYAEYAYAQEYGREYSPEDATKLYAAVKEYIVPLYNRVNKILSANGRFDHSELLAHGFADNEAMVEAAAKYMPEVSDEYAAALNLLREKELADLSENPDRIGISFTTYIPYYSIAMIYSGTQDGEPQDLSTFVHEFGHFAYYMYMQEETPLDISEFYSQGMEALYCNFADDLFGEAGDTYRLEHLESLLKSIVNGCLFDEFQVQAYHMSNPTAADLNRLYYKLSLDYGFTYAHNDDQAYNWVTTPHTFIQPFYYLSYAASALPSAELLVRADRDFEDAADKYLSMAAGYRGQTYTEFFREFGFEDIFDSGDIAELASGLEDYLYGEICDTPGLDALYGHWAYDELCYSHALSLLQGDDSGLRPNDVALRCEVFMLMQRILGGAAVEKAAFSDVTDDMWYADAAYWAAESGLTQGDGSGRFNPQAVMTRQEVITVLYRAVRDVLGEEVAVADPLVLAAFADYGDVADWAVEAMAWAVEQGYTQGNNGELMPLKELTRAELAVLLMRCFGF